MTDPTNKKPLKVKEPHLGIICVGGCGVNNAYKLAKALKPEEHKHLSMLVLNTDNEQLQKLFGETSEDVDVKKWMDAQRLSVLMLGETGKGAGGNPEVGEKGIKDAQQKIDAFIRQADKELDAIILVGGLGGGTGTGALPELAKTVTKEGGPPVLALATAPLLFEGPKRIYRAQEAKTKLFATGPTILVYNEALPDKDVPFKRAWEVVNDSCLVPILRALREIIQVMGDVKNIDLEDYRAVLSAGNYVYFGLVECKNESGVTEPTMEDLAKQLVAKGSFQDTAIVERSLHMLLWFHGVWTIKQCEELATAIKSQVAPKKMDEVQATDKGEINWGMYTGESNEPRWVAMIAVASAAAGTEAAQTSQAAATGPVLVPPPKEKMVPVMVDAIGGSSKSVTMPERLANKYREIKKGVWGSEQEIDDTEAEVKKYSLFTPHMGAAATAIQEKRRSKVAVAGNATVQ